MRVIKLLLFICICFYACITFGAAYYNTGFLKKVRNIRFSTGPQTLFASNCSGTTTIRTYVGNTPTNVPAPLTVNLSGTNGVTFYSDATCNYPITDATILAGNSTVSFYFLTNNTGPTVISTTATNFGITTQTETVNTNPFIWTGGGADANWTTAGNWSGGAAPGSGNLAVFNGTCVTNCSPVINANISVAGIRMATGYTGTITQSPGITILLNSHWVQQAGTFVGGNSSIQTYQNYSAIGGTFTSTSGVFTVNRSLTIAGSANFIHNSGTVRLIDTATTSTGSTVFNHFQLIGSATTFTNSGTIIVNGDLTISDTHTSSGQLLGGEIHVKGNVIINNYGLRGNGLIKIAGSTNQSVTGSATACLPSFEIASTGGTVSYVNQLKLRSHYTYTSGVINPGTSSLNFNPDYNTPTNITTGPENYNDVTFTGYYARFTITGTMNVSGNLLLEDTHASVGYMNGGTIAASGNVEARTYGYTGTTNIRIAGSGAQTITGISSSYFPAIEIANTGTVTLSGTVRIYQNFLYTSGTMNAGTSLVVFNPTYLGVSAIDSGAAEFNNVTFEANYGTYNLTGTMKVNGNLTLNDTNSSIGRINSGTIQVKGNLIATNYGNLGTARIELVGPNPASISQASASARILKNLVINKDPGVLVTLLTNTFLNETGDTLTVTSGNVDMAGKNLTVRTTLSLNGNTITKNGGVLTVNSAAVGTGSLHGGTVNP